jgi:hypothetical protein
MAQYRVLTRLEWWLILAAIALLPAIVVIGLLTDQIKVNKVHAQETPAVYEYRYLEEGDGATFARRLTELTHPPGTLAGQPVADRGWEPYGVWAPGQTARGTWNALLRRTAGS